jgi:hypothetical protein
MGIYGLFLNFGTENLILQKGRVHQKQFFEFVYKEIIQKDF